MQEPQNKTKQNKTEHFHLVAPEKRITLSESFKKKRKENCDIT